MANKKSDFRALILHDFCFQLCSSDTGSINEHEFQEKPRFPGAVNSCYAEKMSFLDPDDGEAIPVYRVMDRNGKVLDESHDPKVKSV